MENSTKGTNSNLMIPGAILLSGILIAGAVIYSSGSGGGTNTGGAAIGDADRALPQAPGAVENLKPVTKDDHIRGDIDAPIKIVEFSDLECPFCKRFHATMQQVMTEYDGKVAWVYRHFPLDAIHSKARKEAEATECANELGGNDAFWAYMDRIFEITPSNNRLELDQLPQIAEDVGLDRVKFQKCLDSGKYADHIADDLQDGTNSGARGTPYSVLIGPDGEKAVISGAQPYSSVKQIIDLVLK